MSKGWPPLDTHAHLDVDLSADEVLTLRAVVFAATRSLEEAEAALARQPRDLLTVWGVGVHPGVASALSSFDVGVFRSLISRSALVSEVGLDARVPSRLELQGNVLGSILAVLQESPRITSLHSYGATDELLAALERVPIRGVILHWWRGSPAATRKALSLGAHFSLNFSNVRDQDLLEALPLDRILLETDHPDGDRWSRGPRRPGAVDDVESALGKRFGLSPDQVRLASWMNLRNLVTQTETKHLLPERIASMLGAL